MPASYEINIDEELVVFSLSNTVTEDHVLAAGLRLSQDPVFQPSYDSIWDFTDVTGMDVTLGGLKRIRDFEHLHKERIGSGRRAVIVTRSTVTIALNTYLWLCSPGRLTKTFSDMEGALAWFAQER